MILPKLTDDPLILPKLTDYLGVPLRPDEGTRASMPPGAMTVSMSADHAISSHTTALNAYRTRKGDPEAPTTRLVRPIRPDRSYGSSDDVRYNRDRSLEKVLKDTKENDRRQNMRASSWNRLVNINHSSHLLLRIFGYIPASTGCSKKFEKRFNFLPVGYKKAI